MNCRSRSKLGTLIHGRSIGGRTTSVLDKLSLRKGATSDYLIDRFLDGGRVGLSGVQRHARRKCDHGVDDPKPCERESKTAIGPHSFDSRFALHDLSMRVPPARSGELREGGAFEKTIAGPGQELANTYRVAPTSDEAIVVMERDPFKGATERALVTIALSALSLILCLGLFVFTR